MAGTQGGLTALDVGAGFNVKSFSDYTITAGWLGPPGVSQRNPDSQHMEEYIDGRGI
jgi:hypothetical protein